MHEHDLDLIAALADGSLTDETEARALVETCAVCQAELRSQTDVLHLLATVPPPEMTELEKAALHRDLWSELRREPSPASARWWQQWSYVAAGLFVAVGLVGVLNGALSNEDGAASLRQVASDLDSPPAGDELAPFAAEDAGGDAAQSGGAATTAAAEEALPVPFHELADEARASQQAEPEMGVMSADESVRTCLDSIGLDDHVVVDEIELDQTYLLVMAEDAPTDPSVTFVTLTDCEIVYVDR